MRDFKDFDTMEKELKEKRGVISAFDFAKEAEEPQEEKNTEKDAKFEDLKNLLFNHAADSRELFLGTDVENSRTAEMRRSAKHEALISLISNAGLGFEYCEWLRKKYE